MSPSRFERLAPLTGVLFAVFFYVAIALTGGEPDADRGAAKIVDYWTDNGGREMAVSGLGVIAVVAFVWFAGCLRTRLREAEGGSGRVSTTAWAGALMFAVGLLVFMGLSFTLADAADDLPVGAVQALNALNADLFFPAAGGGALLYLATGAVVVRTRVFPVWFGWVSVVLGVAAMTPAGFVPFLVLGLWVLIVSGLLYRGTVSAVAPASPAPAAA